MVVLPCMRDIFTKFVNYPFTVFQKCDNETQQTGNLFQLIVQRTSRNSAVFQCHWPFKFNVLTKKVARSSVSGSIVPLKK